MSYRDDVDTLYTRAMILQRELDAAKAEVAELRNASGRPRADTSPGIHELRQLPDPEEVLARLAHITEREPPRATEAVPPPIPLPPRPMPSWSALIDGIDPIELPEGLLMERVRDNVARLRREDLLLVAKIVEQLTDTHEGMDAQLRARLRWLASEIALVTT